MRLKKSINIILHQEQQHFQSRGASTDNFKKAGGESPLRETVFTVKITQRLHKRVTQKPRDEFDDKEKFS